MVVFYNPLREREPAAVAGLFLGREEWLEDLLQMLRADAQAVVGHNQVDLVGPLPQPERKGSCFRQGIERILELIGKRPGAAGLVSPRLRHPPAAP